MRITISERGRIGRRNGGNCLGDMESPYRDVAQTGSDGVCDHSISGPWFQDQLVPVGPRL